MLCPRRAREATTTLPSAGPQLDGPTPRKTEALALMAEGPPNGQIAQRLVLSDGAVAKHVANIFLTLDLPPGEEARRTAACGPCSSGCAPTPEHRLRAPGAGPADRTRRADGRGSARPADPPIVG